jgi:selenoprotein W-related protein
MVELLLGEFEQNISHIALVPGAGGVFEVDVDGALVYSKKATGRHAEPEDVLAPVRDLAGA